MLLGLVGEIGLVGVEIFVRPRPLYSAVPLATPFVVCSVTGEPSVTADKVSCSGFGIDSDVFSSIGESGGGGMFVPAVRDSSGARTGSSNRLAGVAMPFDATVVGIVVCNVPNAENATVYDCTGVKKRGISK